MKLILCVTAFLCLPLFALAQDDRTEHFDNELVPLMKELFGSDRRPNHKEMEDLATRVHRFKQMKSTSEREKPVVMLDMDPFTWRTMLNDMVLETAVIAFCSSDIAGLKSCVEAAKYLQVMTRQCSQTVLGLIDLDAQGYVPLNLFQDAFPDPGDPNFIMLKRHEENMDQLTPVRRGGSNPSSDFVAAVLCAEESDSFGHVFKFSRP